MWEHEQAGPERARTGERVPDPSAQEHAGRPRAGADTALSLQRTVGNAAVARWLSAGGRGADDRVVQRDDAGTAPGTAEQAPADEGMTPDTFQWMFDPDTLAQAVASAGDSDLGAADLVPDPPRTAGDQDAVPTAQALSLQRDPPAGTGPDPKQTKPGTAGDGLKAVLTLPQVFPQLKLGLGQVKQLALTDWKTLVHDPLALSVFIPVSVMIAAGTIGGIESSPDARRTVNPLIFGKDIPVPVPDSVRGVQLPGLSVKILGTGAEANGLVLTLDFAKVLGWKPPTPSSQEGAARAYQ